MFLLEESRDCATLCRCEYNGTIPMLPNLRIHPVRVWKIAPSQKTAPPYGFFLGHIVWNKLNFLQTRATP